LEYEHRTGDIRPDRAVAEAVRNRKGLAYFDDDLWSVIATTRAWRREADPELLAYATDTFRKVVTQGWDNTCGGGLWWNAQRKYKNAITNELLIFASTQLYYATGQDAYRGWAQRGWEWFAASGMIDKDGLVNDGLDGQCRNNGAPKFSYNQGVILGGLEDLASITGDQTYRDQAVRTALAATRELSNANGILHEPVPSIGSDGLMFKGVFAWHLGRLLANLPAGHERDELAGWTRVNADAVWQASEKGARPVPADWTGNTQQIGAAAQASGIDMLVAAVAADSVPAAPVSGTAAR